MDVLLFYANIATSCFCFTSSYQTFYSTDVWRIRLIGFFGQYMSCHLLKLFSLSLLRAIYLLASSKIFPDFFVSIPAISSKQTAKSRNLVTNSSVTAILPEV